jgi:hypothetical protein
MRWVVWFAVNLAIEFRHAAHFGRQPSLLTTRLYLVGLGASFFSETQPLWMASRWRWPRSHRHRFNRCGIAFRQAARWFHRALFAGC